MKSLATVSVLLLCWSVLSPSAMASENATPPSWENTGGIPPVGNQMVGGSCFAWAAAYYYLTHLQWQEYGWDVTDPGHQCSPAFVYNLTNGGVDNGASEGTNARADAFRLFETMGCATMADMPYDYRAYRTFPTERAFRNGMTFRTLATHQITTRTDSGLQVLKDHLAAGNLAVMGIFGYGNFDNINSNSNTYCVSETYGKRLYWHEVTVVGYDDSMQTADGYGAFRLVNSFGTGWGDNGYFWMSYNAVKAPKTSYGYVMYATDRIGYEPTLTARVDIEHENRYELIYRAGLGDSASPDTLLTFFEFYPMSLARGIGYPDGAFVLDISDMRGLLQTGGLNKIFIRVENTRQNTGYDGTIRSLMVENLTAQLCVPSHSIPVDVEDLPVAAEVTVTLDYSSASPQSFAVDVDSATGLSHLSWSPPSGGAPSSYGIYVDGKRVDSASALTYEQYLSLRGARRYGVSAIYPAGESPAAMKTAEWEGPTAYGIPYEDGFEHGFGGWYQAGTSGVPLVTAEDPVYSGDRSARLRTFPSGGYTVLIRPFGTVEGAEVETWTLLDVYPDAGGGGGSLLLAMDGVAFGTFISDEGHPGFLQPAGPNDLEVGGLDTTVTLDTGSWYKQKIWYSDGLCQIMVLDSGWNVILNDVAEIPDQSVNQVAYFADGMGGGTCYYDEFSIKEWSPTELQRFSPVTPTETLYALLIERAIVDTSALEPGDEIAIYDGGLCVGGAIVDGEWPLEMNAYGADSSGPGFSAGNPIEARIWRQGSGVEYQTEITYSVGDGTFGGGLFSRVALEATTVVSVEEESENVPLEFVVSEPYPNPFNPATTVEVTLPEDSHLEMILYNALGQRAAVVTRGYYETGLHRIEVDGRHLASGVYYYRVTAGQHRVTGRMMLLK